MLHPAQPGPWTPRWLVGFDLRRRPHLEADVLVIGSGVAGLCAALAAAEAGRETLLLAKGSATDSNTFFAQGGVAAVLDPAHRSRDDSVELHVTDTLTAGAGLCDEPAVRDILAAGDESIAFLTRHGCRFDGAAGAPDLTREGGHSARRILHANGDATGQEVVRALVAAVNAHPLITVIDNAFAIDLLMTDGAVAGVLYYRRNELFAALAGSTILATGGAGRVWRETSNPPIATGDGLAMAYRAGAQLVDLEFMQFHPTTLYIAGGARLLITEAMRGEGAVLKNHGGERFMPRYHADAELAPRDVVTRAIIAEIRASGFPHVWLDATHLGPAVRERFPAIAHECGKLGIDIATQWIPVHPSAHYHCGGVLSDVRGRTSLARLWAAGEVGCTGLHGANRLASNSILEGIVVGMRAGADAAASAGFPGRVRGQAPELEPAAGDLDVADLARSLRALMWRAVGIERSGVELATARRTLAFWLTHQARGAFRDRAGWQLQNLLAVGSLVATAAEARSASVGTHHRSDGGGAFDRDRLVFVRPEHP